MKKHFENPAIEEYGNSLKFTLAIKTFHDSSYTDYKEECESKQKPCIYTVSRPITSVVKKDTPMLILEMNTTIHRIMGIGFIRNCANTCQDDEHGKRTYTYIGDYHLTRDELTTYPLPEIMSALDQIVFQDSRPLKRLPNIHLFPLDVLYNIDDQTHINIVKELQNAFRTRFFSS